MSFANPSAFWIFAILALLGTLFAWQRNRSKKQFQSWISRKLWGTVIPEYSEKVFLLKSIFLIISCVFIVISLARPQWGEKEEVLRSEGMDLIFVLDVSSSMLAEDVTPSRLNRAQSFIKKTLALLPNDRAGVVAFAGSAFLAVPLTTDFNYVTELTDSLDPSMISNQGTDLGQAMDVAIKAFQRGGEGDVKTSRAIILVSDGEDFGAESDKVASTIKDFGVQFFSFSVGTPEGAPIPVRNETGVLQTYKKDPSGTTVLTRANKALLQKLTDRAGGKYTDLLNAEDAAFTLSKELSSLTRGSQKEQHQITKIDRYQIFTAVAVLFLFLHLLTGYRAKGVSPVQIPKKTATVATAMAILFLLVPSAQAQSLKGYLNSKKGYEKYQAKDYEGAVQSYEEARKGDTESPTLLFNEATSLAQQGKNDDAKIVFNEATKKALSEGDYDTAAKSLYNEGVMESQANHLKESYDRLTKAIEMAKITKQPDLEKKAREALIPLKEKQKQQSKENKEKKKQDQDKSGKEKKDQKGSGDGQNGDQKKDDQNGPGKDRQDKNGQGPTGVEKRGFKSGTVSKDVAESIMNDLSDREKQLYQKRLKDKKQRETTHDKDW